MADKKRGGSKSKKGTKKRGKAKARRVRQVYYVERPAPVRRSYRRAVLTILAILILICLLYVNRDILSEMFSRTGVEIPEGSELEEPELAEEPEEEEPPIEEPRIVWHVSDVEQLIFDSTNEIRKVNRLDVLEFDADLSRLARAHSKDMLDRNFFDHINPDGENATTRAMRMGIQYERTEGNIIYMGIGENIGEIPFGNVEGCGLVEDAEDISDCVMDGWMNSPGHRANILHSKYIMLGVGVSCNEEKCMTTQNFF